MNLIRPFDPWGSKLCTCPPKYSLNPYTGCAHGCIYCYASAYIPRFYHCRPKKELIKRLTSEVRKTPPGSLISLSNTSDPYPPMEETLKNTRRCLELFKFQGLRVLIITKSKLVQRDAQLLSSMNAAVTMTITSLKHFERLEPGASSPELRLEALKKLSWAGIPVGLRLDPIFPWLTDDEIEEIIHRAAGAGATHVVASTFKPRWDSWRRFAEVFPEVAAKTYKLYFEIGERSGNAWLLPQGIRKGVMLKAKKTCEAKNLTFACCREGLQSLHTAESCDGSWLTNSR